MGVQGALPPGLIERKLTQGRASGASNGPCPRGPTPPAGSIHTHRPMARTTPKDGLAAQHRTSLVTPGHSLGVIGVGVMGKAILRGLLNSRALDPAQAWGTSRSPQTCATTSEEL